MCRTYLILSFSGYFSLIVVKVGTHQATSSCNTLRRHVAATNRSLYTREFLSKSLSPQQTFVRATSRKKSKIRLNLRLVEATKFCCCDKDLHMNSPDGVRTERFVTGTCRPTYRPTCTHGVIYRREVLQRHVA